jgi:NAD(P)-dependent dehydrogenase (short-subunit alcohol dehydrogenase family)
MTGLLNDKAIFLTGGSAGIGFECAKAYAREGARVAICCPDLKEAQQAAQSLGENHLGLGCDVSNGTQVSAAIDEVLAQFGRLDAIHNNAGIASPSATLHETTEAEWDRLFAINVKEIGRAHV